ncbi:MAG: hypothetical protein OHK0039_13660 [Bacteroidia bacterium]
MTRNLYKTLWAGAAFLLSGGLLHAQTTTEAAPGAVTQRELFLLLIATMIVVAVVCLVLAFTVLVLVRQKQVETVAATQGAEAAAQVQTAQPSVLSWSFLKQKLTDAVPVEKENTIDMGHNYDGIRELDNNLPPWWKWGFYFTIGYAAIYLLVFHVFGDWSSKQEYDAEIAEAAAQKEVYLSKVANLVDESNVVVLADAAELAAGKEIYVNRCLVCHGDMGQGGVGPNLTDAYWLHGGSVKDIFSTIKYGVPTKGMQAWQAELKPQQMQQVSSYILTMQGTNPPNAKEPQGELYQPEEAAPAAPAADDTTAVALLGAI